MFASRLEIRRFSRQTVWPGRAALVAASALAALAAAPASSLAAVGDVELKSVFASPVDASPFGDGTPTDVQNERSLCTPEPSGRRIYGTSAPFTPNTLLTNGGLRGSGWPESVSGGYPATAGYVAPNFPSKDDLVPVLQAGANTDLCFGFTLTPNVQPDYVRTPSNPNGRRIQDDPPVPDTPATHVALDADRNAINNDDLKTIAIDMPAGFSGDPDGGPTCTTADFAVEKYVAALCDDSTLVGTAFLRAYTMLNIKPTNPSASPSKLGLALGGSPNRLTNGALDGGLVYNLEHGPNELGRLGVSLQPASGLPPAKFIVRLQLAPDGSGRVRTLVDNAPRNIYQEASIDMVPESPTYGLLKPDADPIPLYVESIGIRAWGSKAEHPTLSQDFAEWGTNCTDPIKADVSLETYLGTKSTMASSPIQLTGCDQLPFLPSLTVETTERRPGVPTATEVKVGLGQTASGLKTALLRDATVTLPSGLELGAQAGSGPNGLPLCSAAQFGFTQQDVENTCPAASKTGEVTILTPLQNLPLVGSIYLGEQPAVGELPALYMQVSPEGATAADAPRIKLKGSVSVDANGNITTTFKDNPQLRFSELRLKFPGGDNALFSTPRACGTTTGTSKFVSWAGSTVDVVSSLVIDQDCATPAFAPTLAMAPADSTVGASSPTTITLAREDRSPWLKDFKVSLPPGFLADLNSITECSAAQAATGACPGSSRMGSVVTTAGVGPKPLTLGGEMFFTERESGSVAGAVIVVRAKIGDIDLGDVVVPARINLRPTDGVLELTTSAPTRFKGLALNLRSFTVTLDRSGFPLNPTACGPLLASAQLTGDGGQTATANTNVSFTGCAARPLGSKITPTLSGDLKASGHPELKVVVENRKGDTNLKTTSVMLPAGVSSDPKNLKNLCPLESFNAASCPAASRVGSVSANVAITSETVSGDLLLVKVPGEALPGIGMNFTGRYALRVLSKVKVDSKTARLITVFDSIPDFPITRLDLTVSGGALSPIIVSGKLCDSASSWDANFGGQGGQSLDVKVPFDCSSPKPTLKWSRKAGLTFVVTATSGKTLKSSKLTLPKGFKLDRSKKGKKNLKVSVAGGKAKTKVSKTSVAIVASGAGPTKVTIKIKPKGLILPKTKAFKKGLKKGAKLKVTQRTVTSDGRVAATATTVKVG